MIIVMGTVRIPPENIAAALAVMTATLEATRAEDGCLAYAYAVDLLDPGLIHIAERWRDTAALVAHSKAPHLATWRAAQPGLGLSERNIRMYETDEGVAV